MNIVCFFMMKVCINTLPLFCFVLVSFTILDGSISS
jgi:hypothetical protein